MIKTKSIGMPTPREKAAEMPALMRCRTIFFFSIPLWLNHSMTGMRKRACCFIKIAIPALRPLMNALRRGVEDLCEATVMPAITKSATK